jgi:transglutaminase-like putative cysteine protease
MSATLATTKIAATPRQMRWALLALAAAILPFLFSLPPWVAGAALGIVGWRLLALYRHWRQPSLILRLALVFLGILAVVAAFRGFGGAEAGGAFLVITASLKALESHNRRDFRIVALLAFMLLAAAFLLEHSLPLALYAVCLVWLATTALLIMGTPDPEDRKLALRAARLLISALPIAIALFLLFPRLPGPLFHFGGVRMAAVSGLADSMSPGSIAGLAQSDEIAFRVHFEDAVPPPSQRYFRGPVFTHYDGESWLPPRHRHSYRSGRFEHRGRPVHYRVLERSNATHFLFALALPAEVSTRARLNARYELRARNRLWHDVAFTAKSWPRYRAQPRSLPSAVRQANLELPANIDPRARALAEKWRRESDSPQAVVQHALDYYRRKPFYYTLAPGLIRGDNRIDQFLFDKRRGFCEHYAGSFVFLMRAAGLPTRVVTGYAGGEVNPYDGWLVLRQLNAHAWAEVWMRGRGWVRVDPTSVIPAARVETSASGAVASGASRNGTRADHGLGWQARNLWDATSTLWSRYVIGYDAGLQHHLLDTLGLGGLGPTLTAFLMAGVAVGAGLIVFMLGFVRRREQREDPARRLYERWCRGLARQGLRRRASEGPLDFSSRIERLRPRFAASANEITTLYLRARYAGDEGALKRLKERIRQHL